MGPDGTKTKINYVSEGRRQFTRPAGRPSERMLHKDYVA
jgi:hypothetical protein